MAETQIAGRNIGDGSINHLDLNFSTTPVMTPPSSLTAFVVWDSGTSLTKKVNFADLETYFNSKYSLLSHTQAWSTITGYQTIDASNLANAVFTGGGIITISAAYDVLWSQRFILISNGNGSHFSTSGYFDITCPITGTITGVGGAVNKTATAAGIPLAAFESLYYILPIGSNNASVAANFRVVSYTSALVIPNSWIKICSRAEGNYIEFATGTSLRASTSLDTNAYDVLGSDVSGAVGSALILANARTINGVNFNGSANITIADSTKVPLTGAIYIQSSGLSGGWGGTNTTNTGAFNAVSPTNNASAFWLLSGSTAGVFKYGMQGLDSGGQLRFYEGANWFTFSGNVLTANSFAGAGTGLTGTASSLTVGSATNATKLRSWNNATYYIDHQWDGTGWNLYARNDTSDEQTNIHLVNINGSADSLARKPASFYKQQIVVPELAAGGNKWLRIAKTDSSETGNFHCKIDITNLYNYNGTNPISLYFSGSYRGAGQVVQTGGSSYIISQARIVYPTTADTDYYIEVFIQQANLDRLTITLSDFYNISLYSSPATGSIPANYLTKSIITNQLAMTVENMFATSFNGVGSGLTGFAPGLSTGGNIARQTPASGFMVGSYNIAGQTANSQKSSPIYVIGSSYGPTETTLSNMYGIGYSHSDFWGAGKTSGWGLYVAESGIVHATIGASGIWTSSSITANAFFSSSDMRLKDLVEDVQSAEKIESITYTWKDKSKGERVQTGYSAQEVKKYMPNAVNEDENGMLSVNYIQVLVAKVQALEKQLKKLQDAN